MLVLFTFEITFSLFAVAAELYRNREDPTFKKRYRPLTFAAHLSFMLINVGIYIGYTQLTGSTVLVDYPKLTCMAYGGQFL